MGALVVKSRGGVIDGLWWLRRLFVVLCSDGGEQTTRKGRDDTGA